MRMKKDDKNYRYVELVADVLKDVDCVSLVLAEVAWHLIELDKKKIKIWDVRIGDTDGETIGQVEGTEDEAWLEAMNKYDPGWEDRTDREEEEGGYDTYNYIYIREQGG